MPYDYIKQPDAIYRNSFKIINDEANLDHLSDEARTIAIRLAHACGMVSVAEEMQLSADFIENAKKALREGNSIYVDTEMVRYGIITTRLTQNNPVICTLNHPLTATLAQKLGTTRSAAATELWDKVSGSLIVIGNAPTALFHVLETIEAKSIKPAAIIGLPVGFVGAAESKDALMQSTTPWLSLPGRLGGSAMASSVVNALSGLIR